MLDITQRLVLVVGSHLQVAPDSLALDTPLFEGGLELDSFAVVEIIGAIEKEFGFQFDDDDFQPENFVDLGTLSGVVARYIDAPARA